MQGWITIVVLYVVALGFFRLLGGFHAAGEAFRRWGAHGSAPRVQPGSSS